MPKRKKYWRNPVSAKFDLESLIDSTSLSDVVGALSLICSEKAEHIRENWQDYSLARKWDSASKRLDTLESVFRKRQL
jgi:hypothetical protein